MVVPAGVIYFGTAALLGVGGLAIAGLGLRKDPAVRRLCLVGALPALSMAAAYVFMGLELMTVETAGREQSLMRFVGYTVAIAAFVYIVRSVIGLSNRTAAVLAGVLLLQPWLSLISWVTPEPLASLLSLGALLGTLSVRTRCSSRLRDEQEQPPTGLACCTRSSEICSSSVRVCSSCRPSSPSSRLA